MDTRPILGISMGDPFGTGPFQALLAIAAADP